MVRLAMILIGAAAFRERWWSLCLLGLAAATLGLWLIADASDGELFYAVEMLGLVLVLQGAAAGLQAMGKPPRVRPLLYGRALALLVLGGLVAMPLAVDHGIPDRLLFGGAFLVDGALRAASAWVVRFQRWPLALAAGLAEVFVAVAVATNWPLHHHYTVPMCFGIVLIVSGWSSVLLALQLKRLPPGASITTLPLYASPAWHQAGGTHGAREAVTRHQEQPMTLYVWTPVGSSADPQRRLVVDRYIAAVDAKGVVSTGHSALERLPDLYISHYPGVEIDHSPDDFLRLLRAGRENDIPGRWLPNHADEVASWCEADQAVPFHYYNAALLEDFWARYRTDSTYNLTRRSCSTVTSLAIESALEGSLASPRALLTFFLLLLDPNLWMAAMLRRRGATMAWTPGLVLDYARLLRVIVGRRRVQAARHDAAPAPAADAR